MLYMRACRLLHKWSSLESQMEALCPVTLKSHDMAKNTMDDYILTMNKGIILTSTHTQSHRLCIILLPG